MMVVMSRGAELDLDDINEYICEKLLNPIAAKKLMDAMREKVFALGDFPKMGQILESEGDLPSKYRVLHVKNYLVFYEIMTEVVLVHRVVYGRRDFLEILGV